MNALATVPPSRASAKASAGKRRTVSVEELLLSLHARGTRPTRGAVMALMSERGVPGPVATQIARALFRQDRRSQA